MDGNSMFTRSCALLCIVMCATTAYAQYNPIFVTPEETLYSSGFWGEPETFSPDVFTYTLENYRTNTEHVTITTNVAWLTPPAGPVAVMGSGGTTPVNILINANVGALAPGFHVAEVYFDSAYPRRTRLIEIFVKVQLCEVLDVNCDEWEFTTGGDAEWYGQIDVFHHDGDAAQSGAIANNQETWFQTILDNPGDISFWWRVSSEEIYAPLEFYVNGVLMESISGNVNWQQETITLAVDDPDYLLTNEFVLRWRYVKDRAFAVGADAGWVDYLTFEPFDALTVAQTTALPNQHCMIDDHTAIGCGQYTVTNTDSVADLNWTVSWTHGWLDVDPASGTLPAGESTTVDVCLTAAAEELAPGAYTDALVFTNTDTMYVISRTVTLRLSEDPPDAPSSPTPVDGALEVSPAVATLSWLGSDSGGCLTNYTIYFGNDPGALAVIYGPGPDTSYALPLLDEDITYYWQVAAENCCGASDASPVWQFTTGFLNALVYFVPCGGGVNYAATALANLEFSAFSTGDVATFEGLLNDPARNWDVVIVDVQGGILAGSTLDALLDYYDDRDGRIIFSHSNLDAFPGQTHEFLGRAGIEYLDSYTEAKEIYVWQAEPMFTLPNVLPSILLTTQLCPEFGHYVKLRAGSRAYAGYTFESDADMAAIVVNAEDRIIINAFRPQTITGDQNGNGIPDMVELYENQLVVATPYGCDPDETPPEISLLGANPLTMECGDVYESPGANAWDFCDGHISHLVDIDTAALNAGVVGTYTVYYSVTDSSGNVSETLERTVEVVDTTPPLIALLGDILITLECGYEYVSPGAFALDACDGIVNDDIEIDTSQLDINAVGTYTVYYSVTDTAGNTSEVLERTVTVFDTEAPIITLLGDNPMTVECGDAYVEPGAIADDACSGDLTPLIEIDDSSVDIAVVGVYEVVYTVEDGGGNIGEAVRTVEVTDTTSPVILLGTIDAEQLDDDGFLLHECSATFIEPDDFEVIDVCDGDLGDVQVDLASGIPGVTAWAWALDEETHAPLWNESAPADYSYDTFTVIRGDYLLIYIATDASGNVYPELDADRIPTALFDGDNPDFLDADGTLKPAIDFARLVRVNDSTPPTIELLGDNPLTLECASEYVSPGVLAEDDCDGDVSENVDIDTSALDMGNVGEYDVLYSVTDASGNVSEVLTRRVVVEDTTIPVITLLDEAFITMECGDDYEEPGATADDACDGDISDAIVIGGVVDTRNVGTYVLTYNVSDSESNAAIQMLRVIYVEDTMIPEITLLGDAEVTVECGDPYDDAGATAADHCDGDLTALIVVGGDVVDVNTVGEYVITYNATDREGHAADEITRTVTVVDTTIPVITRLGDERIVVECADIYNDPGATADDHCDGDITDSIVVDNPVDTAVVGEYVITYNVTDGQGNVAVEVTRTIEVVNTTTAVISLPAFYVPIDCTDDFSLAFKAIEDALAITAANPCGDLTADILVKEIKVTYPHRGDPTTYTVERLNTEIIREGKIEGFEGDYTGTLAQTIELFQRYFLFKPAIYEITYAVQEPQPTEAIQIIRIDDQCRGCLGCYSCDSCSQQRPLPETLKQWKSLLSDWLLVGLSMLVLAGLANIGKEK